MVSLTIDGRKVEVPEGATVLEAAQKLGIEIPTLCYHKDLTPHGGCRLCIVEIEGIRCPQTSCTMPAGEGMVVRTHTPEIAESRKTILELLLSDYYDDGYAKDDRDETEFLRWVREYGATVPDGLQAAPRFSVDGDPNPFVHVDFNKCILCTRCVRACAEIQCRDVWGLAERGFDSRIVAGVDTDMLDARCESCGQCVAYCPTGALDNKMSVGIGKADKLVRTTCTYCGVGCQFDLNVKDGKVIRVTSDPEALVNGLSLCVKGRYGYDFIHHPDRLTHPLIRKDGHLVEATWDEALDLVGQKLSQIRKESGPDAIGVLASAKCTNEENYVIQRFARAAIGTNNVDHCARL
jgi:predicted molibdopterin-dependent oxidoreductase YjgC